MLSTTCRNAILLTCLAGVTVASGQRFSYGVKGGVTITDPTRIEPHESKRYVVGGSFEYLLFGAFAVEADVLYRRTGLTTRFIASETTSITDRLRFNVFEVPVVGKYYFRRDGRVQPFILTGYSLRRAHTDSQNTITNATATGVRIDKFKFSSWTPLDVGVSFGTGLR